MGVGLTCKESEARLDNSDERRAHWIVLWELHFQLYHWLQQEEHKIVSTQYSHAIGGG